MEDNLKTWLCNRPTPDAAEKITVSVPEGLRAVGFPDLILEKLGSQHLDTSVQTQDINTLKPKVWTDLSHLVEWSTEFCQALKNNRTTLVALELIRGLDDYPISLAKFHVEEAIGVVESALSFDANYDIPSFESGDSYYAVENILIEDSTVLHDIVRQVFTCLFSKCLVRLVVRTNQFYSAAIAAHLVDLMHQSGATVSEICCLGFDRRETIGNEKFTKSLSSNKTSKLSVVAVVFKQTDTFAAAQGIIDSYFREQYPNLLVLIEETVYDRFVKDWQRYYSHAVQIGPRLDNRTVVTEKFNSKIEIEYEAIDLKSAHKKAGNVISMLKFRTLPELMSLLAVLRKVPYMTIWNDNILLTRDFCLRINQCHEFWLNHLPKSLTRRRFPFDLLNNMNGNLANHMNSVYTQVFSQFNDDLEHVKEAQVVFMKKDLKLRTSTLLNAYLLLLSKHKSLKSGSTVGESVARLRRFMSGSMQKLTSIEPELSRVEAVLKPVGVAILLAPDENSVKSKANLVELIFKNLLIGNAVLLVGPANILGTRFSIGKDMTIPFKMVPGKALTQDFSLHELSLEDSAMGSETSQRTTDSKRLCPKNTYAISLTPEMTPDSYEALTVGLGARYKTIWSPETEQVNYWSFK